MQQLFAPRDRYREETRVEQKQEPEQQCRIDREPWHGREIHGEEQWHQRGGDAGAFQYEARVDAGVAALETTSAEDQPDKGHHRKHEKDAHRQRQLAAIEKLDDPTPLIDRSED